MDAFRLVLLLGLNGRALFLLRRCPCRPSSSRGQRWCRPTGSIAAFDALTAVYLVDTALYTEYDKPMLMYRDDFL